VLGAEIYRLEARDRATLRYAAVLGMTFTTELLTELIEAAGLGGLVALSPLSKFVEADPDEGWRFKHMLVRDVAYAGLPYKVRRQLHERAGTIIEASAVDSEDVADRLAMHFFHAGDLARSWTHSRIAARRAHARYAYATAIDFYRRAIESAKGCDDVGWHDLATVYELLGDVYDLAGKATEAVEAYREARRRFKGDADARAAAMLKEAGLLQRTGAYVKSDRVVSEARRELAGVDGARAQALRARLASRRAFTHYLTGHHHQAVQWSATGVEEAKASGDDSALAFAYTVRHLACRHAGVAEDQPFGELALEMYRRVGDLRMQGHALNNLAISAMQDGRWDASAENLLQAAEIFARIGDTANEANARYNLADLYIRQRRYEQAGPLLKQAGRAAHEVDDPELVALVIRESGRAETRLGHLDNALRLLADARAQLLELGLTHEMTLIDSAEAEAALRSGDPDHAVALMEHAIASTASATDGLLGHLHRILGEALLGAGRREEARAAFEASLVDSTTGDGGLERALSQLRMAQSGWLPEDDAAEMRRDGLRVLERLGVVAY